MIKGIKLQAREIVIVFSAVIILAGYLFYSFWFTVYQDEIDANIEQSQKIQSEITKNDSLLLKAKEIEARKPELDVQAKKLQSQLTSVEAVLSVMNDVKAVVTLSGAEVKKIENVKGATKKELDPALDYRVVKLTYSGTYSAVFAAINLLENNTTRTFTVSDFSMNSKGGTVEGVMTVEMYFAKTPIAGYDYKPEIETVGKPNPFQ